jgi:hypothetical protein
MWQISGKLPVNGLILNNLTPFGASWGPKVCWSSKRDHINPCSEFAKRWAGEMLLAGGKGGVFGA